jgi:hypothetical protein
MSNPEWRIGLNLEQVSMLRQTREQWKRRPNRSDCCH